jgi:hypothetical protein
MVRELRIHYEGDEKLKPGFRAFFREIHDSARGSFLIRWISAGGAPAQDFHTALRTHPDAWNILLLDSEGPYVDSSWRERGLDASHTGSVFWMVQIMESWFMADLPSLKRFYGQHFRESALPANPDIEQIPKQDVLDKLKAATKKCKDGAYHKTAHAPRLLEVIDPERVKKASRQCARFFEVVLKRLSEQA